MDDVINLQKTLKGQETAKFDFVWMELARDAVAQDLVRDFLTWRKEEWDNGGDHVLVLLTYSAEPAGPLQQEGRKHSRLTDNSELFDVVLFLKETATADDVHSEIHFKLYKGSQEM